MHPIPDNYAFISISKFSKIHNVSTSKIIDYLIDQNVLFLDNYILKSNNSFIKNVFRNNKNVLKVDESSLINYLSNVWDNLIIKDEEKEIITDIKDTEVLINKITEASNKTLMFLDFEFNNDNFYEAAYLIVKDGVIIDKKYFFVNDMKSDRKLKKLNSLDIDYEVYSRSEATDILTKAVRDSHYIVAHNSYCDRSILLKNGIFLKKNRFICTSNIFKKINTTVREKSLSSALKFYGKKFDASLPHFAFYDAKMTKLLFDSYISH